MRGGSLPSCLGRLSLAVSRRSPALGEMGLQVRGAEAVREPSRGQSVKLGGSVALVVPSTADFMTVPRSEARPHSVSATLLDTSGGLPRFLLQSPHSPYW